jgi:bifunctional DNA-binding transcriptional regulator/antitoxin component of YhaV-PrlF toxin-antitoxin module
MKSMLTAGGKIVIPDEIRQVDHLTTGDAFELERLTAGYYLLTKQPEEAGVARFTVETASDGLPVIRTRNGVITSKLVKDIESLTP